MSNPAPDLSKLTDQEIIEHLKGAKFDKKSAELAVKKINNEIIVRKDVEIKAALKAKAEPFGTVNIAMGSQKVKLDFKKKCFRLSKAGIYRTGSKVESMG